jgi:hypothetical protein
VAFSDLTAHPIVTVEDTSVDTHSGPAAEAPNPNPPTQTAKLIFIHHSCGENWLADDDGGLGIALRDNSYYVSDTNYGWGPEGIGDRTDITDWPEWFLGPNSGIYLEALYTEYGDHSFRYSRSTDPDPGRENEIILFKSCYPNSNLEGNPDDPSVRGDGWTVSNAKGIYNDLLAYFATRPDKLFVAITAPPVTDADSSAPPTNARAFNNWLVNDWLASYPYNNVAVFDYYNVLTSNGGDLDTNDLGLEGGNHHRWCDGAVQHIQTVDSDLAAYPTGDSHPSPAGNQKATAEFVLLLNVFHNRWRGAPALATAPTDAHLPPTVPAPAAAPVAAESVAPLGPESLAFQDGSSPDPAYGQTEAVILANDLEPKVNLGATEHIEVFWGEEEHRRSLLRWDLLALPTPVTIDNARLELYRYDGDAASPMQIALFRVISDWSEGSSAEFYPDGAYVADGATWSEASPGIAWTTPGGDYDTTSDYGHGPTGIVDQVALPADNSTGWIPFDVTAAVRAWAELGVPNYGLLLRPLEGEYTYHYFYSDDAENPALRPRLVVSFGDGEGTTDVPSPTAKATVAEAAQPTVVAPARSTAAQLIHPEALVYVGAFRLPDGPWPDEIGWAWSGGAMAYYPDGDPGGLDDAYPGSIFGTGHRWNEHVSEISIPVPVYSPAKNLGELNTATTLQAFGNIRGDTLGEMEQPRAGLEYLPAQGSQTSGKLHFCRSPHLDEEVVKPSHGWSELNLSDPRPAGPWLIRDYWNYVTSDYLFGIPQEWAAAIGPSGSGTSGMLLATGRYRDGGQGARGPSALAISPWAEGDPPPGSAIPAIPLLLYTDVEAGNGATLNDYHHSDEWTGAAWLTAGDKAAVLFVGSKGQGDCWYGNAEGPCLECDDRGWWSSGWEGQFLFYDPADLVAVARGEMLPHEPQPYATLNVDQYLYHIESVQQNEHLGAASFDRKRGLLYVFEPLVDEDKPLVHVWRVEG